MGITSLENPQTFGDWAYVAIAKNTDKFQKYETKVLLDQDPENLHQMRVAMRRLRSAIVGFGLGLNLPANIEEKKVGKIASILGELRDLDVLLDTLKNYYLPELPSLEQKRLQAVFKHLANRRKKVFIQVKFSLKSKKYEQIKKSLNQWLKQPTYEKIGEVKIEYILPDLLLPQISNLLLHKGWLVGVNFQEGEYQFSENLTNEELEFILEKEGENLHDLRKEAKKTRYQMELFSECYGQEYQEYLQEVTEIQTILGEIQDIMVLTEYFEEIIETKIENKMPFLKQLLQKKLGDEWSKWHNLRVKFLSDNYRRQFRDIVNKLKVNS